MYGSHRFWPRLICCTVPSSEPNHLHFSAFPTRGGNKIGFHWECGDLTHACLLYYCKVSVVSAKWETGNKRLCSPGYFWTPSERLCMYRSLVCRSSLKVGCSAVASQQAVSALRGRNALCRGCCRRSSLWAAALILKRTELKRSSILRESNILFPLQRYRHGTSSPFQCLLYRLHTSSPGHNPLGNASGVAQCHPRGDCRFLQKEKSFCKTNDILHA